MKNCIVKRLLAGCLAAMLLFGDTAGVLAENLSETEVETEVVEGKEDAESTENVTEVGDTEVTTETTENSEMVDDTEQMAGDTETVVDTEFPEDTETTEVGTETVEETESTEQSELLTEEPEQLQTAVVSDYTGPIYMAYFGLPSILTPKAAASTSSKWSGHRISGLGRRTAYIYGEDGANDSYDDVWKILDPATGLLWADGIFFTGSELESDTGVSISGDGIDAALAAYLTSQTTDGENKYDILERVAIKKLRLPTKAEMMTVAYGFNNVDTADTTRKYAGQEYRLQDAEDGAEIWMNADGSIGNYGPTNGYAPIAELDVSKVFMTVSTDLYGTYTKTDISENGGSAWTLLLDSGDTGFSADIPDVASFAGSITIDVTGIVDSEEYDKISIVLTDAEGDIVAYTDGYNSDTYNSDTYESAPTIGEFRFELPDEMPMGTYTVTVFEEKSESIYEAGYVSNAVSKANVEVTTAIVEDFKVSENRYGQVTLSWNLSNKQSQHSDSYTYCNIYRADSKDGEYELVEEHHECYNGSSSYSWKDTDVTSEQGIMNDTYYYKITTFGVASEWNTELGTYETTYYPGYTSEVVTNADMYYGAGEQGGYKGAYIADENGNRIDSLTIHEGEAKELYVTYVAADGTSVQVTSDDLGGARWYLLDEVWNTVGRPEEVGKEKIGIYPVELLQKTDDEGWPYYEMPTYKVYIEAEQGGTGTYYLTLKASLVADDVKTQWYWQIPVTVVAAVEDETYNQREKIGVETYEEVVQGIRELMKGRDFNASFIGAEVEPIENDVLFDTYAEREGMLPDEGDYLYYQIGERDSLSTFFGVAYAYSPIDFNGGYYCEYFLNVPFITTAAEEAKVDAKVNALVHTKGGALYKYAHPEEGETVTDEQKIKAIYDWIVANVNPNVPGDRRTPIYHTVYHTLCVPYGGYPGSGTCGAFAVLFTRLSREMGIASKVIMGTDQAAHAYNIVELNGKWWFIDANTRRYLSDCDSFTRAQEQAHYMDERFIKNYLSKIDGNDYMVESDGIVIVTNTATEDAVEFAELSDAQDYIVEQAAAEGNETVEYTLTVRDGNMAFPSTSLTFYDEDYYNCYSDRVTIDLGGNTLVIRDGMHGGAYAGQAAISAKRVHNGTISVGDDVRLTLTNEVFDTVSVYEDLNIIYKSTTTTKDYSNYMTIFGGNFDSKIIIEDSVTIDDFFMFWIWPSNVEINTDLTAKYIQFGDSSSNNGKPIIVNGTVTVTDSVNIYAGDYEFESFISKKETFFEAPESTSLTIGKELKLSGMTVWGNYVGTPDTPAGTVEVALKRQFASEEDKVPTEQATVTWSGGIFNYGMEYVTFPMFHFVAKDYVAGELQENKAFSSGTTIGTVAAKGLDIPTWKYNVPLTSANLAQYITVEVVDDGKSFADIEGSTLAVVSESVKVTEESTGNTKSFSSLKKAIDGLANVANKAEGTYTFTFTESTALSANVILPAYVKEAIFSVATEEESLSDVEVDFKGYTLTSPGCITVDAGVHFVNTAASNGKLVSTKKTDITDYAIGLWENVEGVNLSAANGVLMLVGDEGKNTISGDVTAKDIIVWNIWEVEGAVTNSGLHNIGTFICDTFTQKSTNQTNLEKDSVLVVKTKADIYNVTRVFAEDGKNPAIYQMADATVSINGKVDASNGQITYAVLAENDAEVDGLYDTFKDFVAQQPLFATNIKAFPVEAIELQQASATPRYTTLLQKGTQMVVVGEWIVVSTLGTDGEERLLKKFTTWKEASAYIAALSNSTMTYVVEITDNLVLDETLTMPAKAAGIIFRGAGFEEDGKVTVTYANTLKLVTDTTFENITLENVKSVNGKNLSLVNAELNVGGAVALTGTLFMENATLDSDGKINVANIVSNSAGNRILYGGNTSKNILTVTGTVSAGPNLTGDGAIDVTVKAIAESAADYAGGTILLNATKASAVWFTANGNATHKSGKVIKYGAIEASVALQLLDEAGTSYIDLGGFTTFQQALDEINQLADTSAEYRIVLLQDAGDAGKAITTPAKAAHVTISGGDSESAKKLIYKNAITLKCDLTLENIELAPAAASNSITGNKFNLELIDSNIVIGGAVKNIGKLVLTDSALIAGGDITTNDIENPNGTAKVVVTAALTRKNGEITKVVPKFTVNGTAMIFGDGIEVVLSEKATADYVAIDFTAQEADSIRATGIPFVKAAQLVSDSLMLSVENFADWNLDEVTITMMKSAGYLTAVAGTAGAELRYEDADGNTVVNKMLHFADAVTEINNLKTKRDYTITLYGAYEAPKALAMPNKNYVNNLTIVGVGDYIELGHNGNITLTSPTTISGVYFKKAGATEYAAPVNFSTGGYELTIAGKVYFNTPVNFNGGKKGVLEVTDAGQLFTITNENAMPADPLENLVCGSISGFAEVNVNIGQNFVISGYKTTKPTAAKLDVTTLNNAGSVSVIGEAAGSVKATNVNLKDAHLESNGTMNIVNMTLLQGDGDIVVRADAAFNITGKLVCETDKAVLYTRLNAKNVPYLTINGTVTVDNPDDTIGVGVYSADGTVLVTLESGAQLLNAKTATADKFAPVATNVGVGAYPEEGGYFLQKAGSAISVYYADEVAVAVCEGNADTGNLETADIIGYFATFKDAVATIDAIKDKNAEYTIVLLEDVNTVTAPAAVTLPSQAANIIITSRDGEVYDIYYTGNLSLKAATEFVKVRFNPMNAKKQGAAANIAAGNFDLTLRDVEIGTEIAGMKINNIIGSAKQSTTLATEKLMIYGGVTNSKELIIEKPVTVNGAVKATTVTLENGTSEKANELTVKGAFTADDLVMQGFTVVDAANALTIKNIVNETTENIGENQTNIIRYGKNSKGAPNLTVKGMVSGSNEEKVIFDYVVSGATVADYTLVMQSGKYTLSDKLKLATVEKAALSEITFRLAGAELSDVTTVKANKGVYVVDETDNSVLLEIAGASGVATTNCLDYAQAINEINNIADKNADYTIFAGDAGIADTNLTDAKAVSPITMPKKNTAASLTIAAEASDTEIVFTGNISYPGELIFENVVLAPNGDSSISGTKNVSTVTLDGASATFKNISNVTELTLSDARLITTGTVAVTDVILSGVSEWDALAKTTITDLNASEMEEGSYIATKQDAKTAVPMFTVNGYVTLNEMAEPVAWKVLTAAATVDDLCEVERYTDTSLAVAPKEDADKFVAWPFRAANIGNEPEGMVAENLTEYKTIKNEVVNGDKAKMVVRIVQTYKNEAGETLPGEAVTYAKSFDEAVTIINNIGDMTASYRMELLTGVFGEDEPVRTTKNGTAYGAMTLPTKAADVTITSGIVYEDEGDEGEIVTVVIPVVIAYTGTLKVNCDTRFEYVSLNEGTTKTVNKEVVFTPKYAITPSYTGAYELTLGESVHTLWAAADGAPTADIVFASVSISKGTLSLEGADAYVAGAMTVKDLEITGTNYLTTAGKTTITNILDGDATSDTDSLRLAQYFTKTTKATQASATQLAVNGEIEEVEVSLASYTYDYATQGYHGITAAEIGSQKLATLPKASTEDVILLLDTDMANSGQNFMPAETGNLYKQNTGLYYTTEALVVRVVAEDENGNEVYMSDFLTWDEAVKEIDRRADKTAEYEMILLESIEEPVKTLSLPVKAGAVTITSEEGESNYVLFTTAKVTAKCNTYFENIGLFAVKKPKGSNEYVSTSYTMAGGNFELGLADMKYTLDGYNSLPSTVSGGAKGTLTVVLGSEENNSIFAVDKISGFGTVNVFNETMEDAIVGNQVESVGIVTKGMSGIGTLNVYPGAILVSDSGTITVKNANIYGATVMAKDITVSATTTLESAILIAGSEAANDGKLKLKDIVVTSAYGEADMLNYLSAEQDKNGKSQITVSGNVSASEDYTGVAGEPAIVVDLYYNNYSSHAKLSDGMVLINAAKADADWFIPAYTTYDGEADEWIDGMGKATPGYGLYNTKKEIVYGALAAED